jgi:UDP-N-acetylmuramoyl-tripeptide--D-alanyl-D-alanine ligase
MLAETARRFGFAEIVGFGAAADADVRLVHLAAGPEGSEVSASVHGRALRFRLNVAGAHYAMNALAVLAAAEAVGVAAETAAARLAAFAPPKGRGTRHLIGTPPNSFELMDDAYNANPWSMNAAFAVLALSRPGPNGRRIAVIGDMRELGSDAPALHAALAEGIAAHGIDLIYACGPEMAHLWAKLPAAKRGAYAATSTELIAPVQAGVRAGDVVLVKGSLGTNMAPIVAALLRDGSDSAPQLNPRT